MNKAYLGRKGEEQAAASLEAAGMKIIAKNVRSKFGEIDIVAMDGNTIVFIEVKAWSVFGMENLQYSVDSRKQQKIIKTAKYFLFENRKYSNMTIRFDIVFVDNYRTSTGNQSAGCQICHLVSAFTESV
jgi:putative endonuclease